MQHFDAAATRAPLTFDQLVPALRAAFAAGASVPPRHVHAIPALPAASPAAPGAGPGSGPAPSQGTRGTVLIMPAWNDDFLGIKTINIFPGNGARGLPGLHATYVLYDATTGVPLALLDGNEITAHRTAAAAALGAHFLAHPDARRLLVLGTGRVARLLPAAHASVRGITHVAVWNHRPEGARALAAQWRAAGWQAEAVTDLEAAVRGADIVSCATLSSTPLVHGDWLAPGSHLDLIGSFTPAMREAAPDCFVRASTFVDTDEAPRKAGDLLDAFAAGTLAPHGIAADLAALCRGQHTGRTRADERTVFKAVGSALEDLVAATLVWRSADRTAAGAAPPLPR